MTARDRTILVALAIASLIAGSWFVALKPKREDASKLNDQIAMAEKERDAALASAQAAEGAREAYVRDYATVARLGKALPAEADVASLVYQIQAAAQKMRIDFRAVKTEGSEASTPPVPADGSAPVQGAGITPVPFSFTFRGSYANLRRLLGKLGNLSRVHGKSVSVTGRLLTVDGVDLSLADLATSLPGLPRKKGPTQVKAEIKAKAYTAEVPPPVPASGAATPGSAPAAPGSAPAAPAGQTPAPNQTAQVTP